MTCSSAQFHRERADERDGFGALADGGAHHDDGLGAMAGERLVGHGESGDLRVGYQVLVDLAQGDGVGVEVEAELFDHGGEFARAFAEHAGELLGCLWFHGAAALFEALEGEVEACLWFVKFGDVLEDSVQAGEAVDQPFAFG